MAVIDKVLVGEGLVVKEGGDNEIAHIDLIMGPRGSAVEDAFCNTLCNNKDGFTSLLAVCAPNLPTKPATVMFNKVTIKGAKQAVQMFGPAQRAVAMAVTDSVKNGTIPAAEANDIFNCLEDAPVCVYKELFLPIGLYLTRLAFLDSAIVMFSYKGSLATKECCVGK